MIQNRPIIGITMGDPFGNGPEITVRALANPQLYHHCRREIKYDHDLLVKGLYLLYRKNTRR